MKRFIVLALFIVFNAAVRFFCLFLVSIICSFVLFFPLDLLSPIYLVLFPGNHGGCTLFEGQMRFKETGLLQVRWTMSTNKQYLALLAAFIGSAKHPLTQGVSVCLYSSPTCHIETGKFAWQAWLASPVRNSSCQQVWDCGQYCL